MDLRDHFPALLKEPLVHFLLAGLGLFLFFAWRGDAVDPESRTITITEAQVERLAASWAQTWQRPPTQTEIDALIRDHVKEEVYYREGFRLGLIPKLVELDLYRPSRLPTRPPMIPIGYGGRVGRRGGR